MKYIAIWLGVVSIGVLLALLIIGGAKLVEAAQQDPTLLWIPGVIVAILALATLITVVEYLTDRRPTAVEGEVIE